jgi:sigma-B regulation protein RsbU (phosphoserine phosphatase)
MTELGYAVVTANELVETMMIIIFWYALSKSSFYHTYIEGKINWKNSLVMAVTFGILGIMATEYFKAPMGSGNVSIRDLPVMLAGMLGGPVAGIGAGLIAAFDRFFISSGHITALPCSVSTIISSLIGVCAWYFSEKRFPDIPYACMAIVAAEVIHLALIWTISSSVTVGHTVVQDIGVMEVLFNFIGMVAFVYFYHRMVPQEKEV